MTFPELKEGTKMIDKTSIELGILSAFVQISIFLPDKARQNKRLKQLIEGGHVFGKLTKEQINQAHSVVDHFFDSVEIYREECNRLEEVSELDRLRH